MSTKEKKGGLFRKKFGGSKTGKKGEEGEGAAPSKKSGDASKGKSKKMDDGSGEIDDGSSKSNRTSRGRAREDQAPDSPAKGKSKKNERGRDGKEGKPSMFQRVRERSRSRSRSRKEKDGLSDATRKDMLVAVTSCRSDGYYNQKAPGSISKLPRKAPTNLKLFHELAVGVKDAYAAVGETPEKPDENGNDKNGDQMSREEQDARNVLWEFIGNLDFVSTPGCAFG